MGTQEGDKQREWTATYTKFTWNSLENAWEDPEEMHVETHRATHKDIGECMRNPTWERTGKGKQPKPNGWEITRNEGRTGKARGMHEETDAIAR